MVTLLLVVFIVLTPILALVGGYLMVLHNQDRDFDRKY